MNKKTDRELGIVIPESMVDVIDNKTLTDEQVGRIVRAITWNSIEHAAKDPLSATLAATLVNTFRTANKLRLRRIKAVRECKKEYERKQREKAKIADETIIRMARDSMEKNGSTMEFHGVVGREVGNNNISPYNPPAGDEKDSSAKLDDHAKAGSPTKGRRTRPSARPTARNTSTSGDSRERPAPSSKKKGGRCRFTDADGFCTNEKMQGGGFRCLGTECLSREPVQEAVARTTGRCGGGDALVETAKRMVAKHPNTKSGMRSVVRALAAQDDPAAVEAAHAAWCATDEWKPDKGQFVQSLAAWIRNGGWTKPPPEKKQARPKAAREEMSFGASL